MEHDALAVLCRILKFILTLKLTLRLKLTLILIYGILLKKLEKNVKKIIARMGVEPVTRAVQSKHR